MTNVPMKKLFSELPIERATEYELPTPQFFKAYWRNGEKAFKDAGGVLLYGGWVIGEEQIAISMPPAWKYQTFTSKKQGNEYGAYCVQNIWAAVMGHRDKWSTLEGGKKQHRVELMCAVNGIKNAVVISATGYNAGNLMSAYITGYNTVKRIAGLDTLPPFAVYLPIGGKTVLGMPAIEPVGLKEKSPIVPIVFNPGPAVDEIWIEEHTVCTSTFESCITAMPLVKSWMAGVDSETGEMVE